MSFDKAVARALTSAVEGVYCYEDAALETFRRAKMLGLRTVYELPTGYFEAKNCLGPEIARDPSLKPFFPALTEPAHKLDRKRRELALADVVVCASRFTRDSVARGVGSKRPIVVLPYGTDLHQPARVWSPEDMTGPLRVLFVGLLAPQKGVHHLFEALSGLPKGSVQVSLAGRWVPGFRDWIRAHYDLAFAELGQVPHQEVHNLCRANHVLVFPSLFDGFGLVTLEAMAAGIPVIATTHSGGPDVIEDYKNGIIVPAGEPSALRAALVWIVQNRERLPDMGARARLAAEQLTWGAYRERLINAIVPHLN